MELKGHIETRQECYRSIIKVLNRCQSLFNIFEDNVEYSLIPAGDFEVGRKNNLDKDLDRLCERIWSKYLQNKYPKGGTHDKF
jgi:hypothetical protein